MVVGVSWVGYVVKALDGNFTLWNLPERVAKQGEYVRVQGRHALPHIYQTWWIGVVTVHRASVPLIFGCAAKTAEFIQSNREGL